MKSVLVTGASGFVGKHVVMPLLKKNFEVHAIYSKNRGSYPDHIHWHQVDLHDDQSVTRLLSEIKVSHLLHLAWYAKPQDYWTSELNLQWLQCSLNLLNAFIKNKGKRAVFIGTCAEYDWAKSFCNEYTSSCAPKSLYGASKYSLQLLSHIIAAKEALSFAWARIFFLFGAHEYRDRLIPSAIYHLSNKKVFHVMNGNQVRDFMYVNDVSDALVSLLDTEVTGPVNIASGEGIAIHALIKIIGDLLQENELIKNREPILETNYPSVIADVSRLHKEVNWRPQYSLVSGMQETIEWWKMHG